MTTEPKTCEARLVNSVRKTSRICGAPAVVLRGAFWCCERHDPEVHRARAAERKTRAGQLHEAIRDGHTRLGMLVREAAEKGEPVMTSEAWEVFHRIVKLRGELLALDPPNPSR